MTYPRTFGSFPAVQTRGRNATNVTSLRLSIAAFVVFMFSAAFSSPAQTFATLASFDGSITGAHPQATLVQASTATFTGQRMELG